MTENRREWQNWPEDKRTDLLHFRVECLMCGQSLDAETTQLIPLVILVQAHLVAVDHHKSSSGKKYNDSPSGKEVLEDDRFLWGVRQGLPFDLLEKQVVQQAQAARKLPILRLLA